MKIKIVYHSMTGNTKKVAEALAKVANVQAEAITENYKLSEAIDLLFIGDGIYAGQMNKKMKTFIQTLDASLVKNVAIFGTYGGQDKVIIDMAAMLKKQGVNVCDETFVCKGQAWFIANRKHPNQTDIDNATKFGTNIIRGCNEENAKS